MVWPLVPAGKPVGGHDSVNSMLVYIWLMNVNKLKKKNHLD